MNIDYESMKIGASIGIALSIAAFDGWLTYKILTQDEKSKKYNNYEILRK